MEKNPILGEASFEELWELARTDLEARRELVRRQENLPRWSNKPSPSTAKESAIAAIKEEWQRRNPDKHEWTAERIAGYFSRETLANDINAALDVEREKYDDLQRSVLDLSHPNCKQLLADLAAERDKVSNLSQWNDRYREQLDAAVEALEQIKNPRWNEDNPIWTPARIAQVALAKIREGK